MAVEPRENRTLAGILFMALAVFLFSGIDTSAKWLNLHAVPVLQIVFCRYAGHFIYALLIYVPQDGLSAFRSKAPVKQFLRTMFLLGSTTLNFMALQYLPITVTTTISFAGPIVISILAIPILGEQVGLRRLLAVCVGFLGVLLVIQPWGAQWHPAMILSLMCLLSASMYFIMTRLLAGIEANATHQLWSSGVATLALAPVAWAVWETPESLGVWVVLALIGAFGALGHICATIAHRWADASILAPLFYTQIIWITLVAIFIFGTWPTVWTLGGGAIIIASGLYIWHRERTVARG